MIRLFNNLLPDKKEITRAEWERGSLFSRQLGAYGPSPATVRQMGFLQGLGWSGFCEASNATYPVKIDDIDGASGYFGLDGIVTTICLQASKTMMGIICNVPKDNRIEVIYHDCKDIRLRVTNLYAPGDTLYDVRKLQWTKRWYT